MECNSILELHVNVQSVDTRNVKCELGIVDHVCHQINVILKNIILGILDPNRFNNNLFFVSL